MRVLAVTNMLPTAVHPRTGTFVEQQIVGIRMAGIEVEVLHIQRRERGMLAYSRTGRLVSEALQRHSPDLVHFKILWPL